MPVNNYSVGRDVTVDIFDKNASQTIKLPTVTGFDSKQETTRVQVKALNGTVTYLELPQGWMGSLDLERGSPALDDFIAALEGYYYSGANVQSANITETVTEPDGSVSQYRYEGCVFKLSDAGSWKNDASVKQKLEWAASRRKKVV